MLEIGDQAGELVIFGIEVGQRQLQHPGEVLLRLQVGVVDPCLVAIDAGAGDELVQARLDAQDTLRDAAGLARLA